MTTENQNQGEGNREAARHYAEKTKQFVESGKVDEAARNATQMSDQEKEEAEKAEEASKSRAREFGPHVNRDDYSKPDK